MGIAVLSTREVVTGLKRLLEITRAGQLPGLVLRCRNAEEALTILRLPFRPEFLLLDSEVPGQGEVQVLKAVRESRLPIKVVVMVPDLGSPIAIEIARSGPAAMISRDLPPSMLAEALRTTFPTTERDRWANGLPLTRRETQVASLARKGLPNREIAKHLYVAEGTVKTHLHEVYRKLNVRNRTELARYPSRSS